ncbi:MAG: hypothetical protein ACYS8Z_03430 [Planctomycetota bacterium]|jgi:hypothetical protein
MIRKGLLLTAVVLLSTTGLVQAGEATRDDIGVSVSGSYLSRYIWYGFDLFRDNHSAFQTSANFDLYGTGWMFDVRWTKAINSGYENWEQLDYTLSYGGTVNPDSTCVTNWRVGWRYYNHPDGPVRASDGCSLDIDRQEFFGTFAWPEITGCGVVPSYTVVYVKPDESGRKSDGCPNSLWRQGGGFIQVLGLAKEVPVGDLCPNNPDQTVRLSADLVHNGSVGGRDVDHDWSHVNWGVQTTVPVGENTTFTPGFVYQTTMDDSINWGDGDEWWFFLTLTHLCN